MKVSNVSDNTNAKKILYVHYGDNWIRGSEIALVDLIKKVKENNYSPLLWCNSEIFASYARKSGVDVIVDNFVCLGYWTKPRWHVTQFLKLIFKAKMLLEQHNISVVHCNNGAPCQWMSPVCKITKTPLLLHLHARYMYRDQLILLFHLADYIVGVSQSVIDILNKSEFKANKVSVIYNGIDPKRVVNSNPINVRKLLCAKKSDFVIVYLGSLIPRKLVHQLLYAVSKLKQNYSVKLVIVGSGSEYTYLTELTNQLNIDDDICFLTDMNEVGKIYSSNADCFISVPKEEVFGLTLAEASLANLPIITSNIPGINEIYTHLKNALLISPNNLNELISSIEHFIKNPQYRKKMADNAHRHIGHNFSLERQFILFDTTYLSLIDQKTNSNVIFKILNYINVLTVALLSKLVKQLRNVL